MRKKIFMEEELPYKKVGKNYRKSSPNKHGCAKTGYNPHRYGIYAVYSYYEEGYYEAEGDLFVRCLDCGKKRARNNEKGVNPDPKVKVSLFDDGYYEIIMNNEQTEIYKLRKMDW